MKNDNLITAESAKSGSAAGDTAEKSTKKPVICIFGLGYIGLTMGATLADAGYEVLGIEPRIRGLDSLRKGKPYFFEPGLDELVGKHFKKRLKFYESPDSVKADVYVVAVGTPVDDKKKVPNLEFVRTVAESIGKLIKKGDLAILRSTVPVGTTRQLFIPTVEKISGLKAGQDFSVAFTPERVVEGNALEEMKRIPQIVGGVDQESVRKASEIFRNVGPKIVPVSSLEAAELVKLFNNTFRDVMFGFANEVALICDGFNLDPAEVVAAANEDYGRSQIPKPSPGVGGYCLTKDPFILLHSTKDHEHHPDIVFHSRRVNEKMQKHVADRAIKFLSKTVKRPLSSCKLGILGFAFKGHPETADTRFSSTFDVVKYLAKKKIPMVGHDPLVDAKIIQQSGVKPVKEIREAFQGVDGVIIMTNHLKYRDTALLEYADTMNKPGLFFDPWHIFKPGQILTRPGLHYGNLGFSSFLNEGRNGLEEKQ